MRHTLTIPSWHPYRLNQLLGACWQARGRMKKQDRDMVGIHARLSRIPRATGKRRVSLVLTLGPRQRGGDPDSYWKSALDALVHAGLLVNDSARWCELGGVRFKRGPAPATTIELDDVSEGRAGE